MPPKNGPIPFQMVFPTNKLHFIIVSMESHGITKLKVVNIFLLEIDGTLCLFILLKFIVRDTVRKCNKGQNQIIGFSVILNIFTILNANCNHEEEKIISSSIEKY